MANANLNNILIPNVSKLPKHEKVSKKNISDANANPNEFRDLLNEQTNPLEKQTGIHLSTHAARRLKERNLEMDFDRVL